MDHENRQCFSADDDTYIHTDDRKEYVDILLYCLYRGSSPFNITGCLSIKLKAMSGTCYGNIDKVPSFSKYLIY